MDERGQIKNIGNTSLSLLADKWNFYVSFDSIGRVGLGKLSDFSLKQLTTQDQFVTELPNTVSYTHLDVYKRQVL